jgi:hypothetical protein
MKNLILVCIGLLIGGSIGNAQPGGGNPFGPINRTINLSSGGVVTIFSTNDTGLIIYGNTNSFFQLNIWNTNQGSSASSDLVATGPSGNNTNYYVNLGFNSAAGGSQPLTNGNEAYLYSIGSNGLGGALHIAAVSSNSYIAFHTGQTNTDGINPPERMRIDTNGNVGIGTNGPTAARLIVDDGLIKFRYKSSALSAVDGTYFVTTTPVFNAGGSSTNIFTNYIPANMLTNDGDAVHYEFYGTLASATASTNSFTVTYGNNTILFVQSGTFSNSMFAVRGAITRNGNVSQHSFSEFNLAGMIVGAPYAYTNRITTVTQTNGIDTRLVLAVTSTMNGGITNLMGRLRYSPAP